MIEETLTIIRCKDELLLGMKLVRFGKGKWNGFGGHLEQGELPRDAAIREVKEELGIDKVPHLDCWKPSAQLDFYFEVDEPPHRVYVYLLDINPEERKYFNDNIKPNEEVFPCWYKINELPYSNMWSDDKYWLPSVLEGNWVEGDFRFNTKNEVATINLFVHQHR